jgi:DNA-binding beta-propeller fold protein YncE
MKRKLHKPIIRKLTKGMIAGLLFGAVIFCIFPTDAPAEIDTAYLYNLSNFSGPIPMNWANIHVDHASNEIYVADTRQGVVSVFNASGMEIYRFGDDGSLGTVLDVAVESNGNIMVLAKGIYKSSIIRCNFRGEPIAEVTLKGLPAELVDFSPDRMTYRSNMLYLLDSGSKQIVITDTDGLFKKDYNLYEILGLAQEKRVQTDIGGFSVDPKGNMLFTLPSLFSAFKLSPDGKMTGFGRPGSAPGRFGVIGGIVADDQGYYYVADRLRCVVLIFDQHFNFQTEFGYRGYRPHNFIGPKHLELDAQGRLYVSQVDNRGISVFKIHYNESDSIEPDERR